MVQDYNKAPEYQCISHGVKLIKSPYPMLLLVILQIKHKLTLRYQHWINTRFYDWNECETTVWHNSAAHWGTNFMREAQPIQAVRVSLMSR